MDSNTKAVLEEHLHRISSKLIFLRDHLERTDALPGLVDVVDDLRNEAGTAIDLWEGLDKPAEAQA